MATVVQRVPCSAMAFTADSSRLASGAADKAVVIWDEITGANITTLRGHIGTVKSAMPTTPDLLSF